MIYLFSFLDNFFAKDDVFNVEVDFFIFYQIKRFFILYTFGIYEIFFYEYDIEKKLESKIWIIGCGRKVY